MSLVDLHRYMAFASIAAVILLTLGGAVRALLNRAPGKFTSGAFAFATLTFMVTIGGGLGLFVGGAHPRELLHFVYAALALATIPFADAISSKASPRTRGLATVLSGILVLVLTWRLFSTG